MGERVLVCGDRNWTDHEAIERELKRVHAETPIEVVIQGEARGADTWGRVMAERMGLEVLSFPALWDRYGRGAGPMRNRQMLEEGRPTQVLAFHPDITHSKGTRDMVTRARKAGIPTRIYSTQKG